ncbi:MAG TPA: methionine--tRNA ligase [Luteibaculaceae bacterium]|nr:methionine--tRNA ligase [Luteibaculaceae bacterium]
MHDLFPHQRYTITAALPYANGPLHIGHLAGAYLTADVFARFLRKNHKEVAFICGSDEHGAAITLRAKKEGLSPKDIVDKYHGMIEQSFQAIGLSFDIYHRTSDPLHHETSQAFFLELYHKGAFEEKQSEQFFDEEAQQFLADRYITGTCPRCANPSAYGDQCEKCGSTLSPDDLINPTSTLSGQTPVKRPTSHWYLPMNRHEQWLREWIENGVLNGTKTHDPNHWKPQVLGQCKSWIDGGLQPRAMTRDLDWGVKVPLPNSEGKVLYVWLDAPIGYITATKAWASSNGKNWEDFWKNPDTALYHFIGKDNIVFHCIIFPILLKEHGGFNLPINVPANEFLNLEGDKISTSRNWAVWLHEYLEQYPTRKDELRYVLTSIAPEFRDSEFTWRDYQARVNNELVAVLGNFVNRAMVLSQKYYNGVVPALGTPTESDRDVLQEMVLIPARVAGFIANQRYREALAEAMNLARLGNKYLADTEPWIVVKTNPERVETIMHISLQICANLSIVLEPFLPFTAAKIQRMMNLPSAAWSQASQTDFLPAQHQLAQPELLFSKVEDEMIETESNKLKKPEPVQPSPVDAALKPLVDSTDFETFTKMDLRIAQITAAERVEKSKKLLKLTVDTGLDVRTVVSGIAEHYQPEEVVGKKVCLLANLAPRKIMGIESMGMILLAEDPSGRLSFVQPADDLLSGSVIR